MDSAGICRPCRMAPPPFERAVSFGCYEGRMRDAIHALKYGRLHPAARRLGEMLAQAIGQLAVEAPAEMLVIPVPLHRSKYAERGFNQARLLAKHALAALRRTHPGWRLTLAQSAVVRLRATQSQASLSPHKRRKNVRGAFEVADAGVVAGKHILVIDDILTTGATARSVAKELLRAGAEDVWVATLARARLNYRGRPNSVYSDRDYEGKEPGSSAADEAPADARDPASMHSSQDQPSF